MKHDLEDLITRIEASTGLGFSENLKAEIEFVSVSPDSLADRMIDYLEKVSGLKLSERERLPYRMMCKEMKAVNMFADILTSKIYCCEENIAYSCGDASEETLYLLKAHELGHLLLNERLPGFIEKQKTLLTDPHKLSHLQHLDEFFADYVMFSLSETPRHKKMIEQRLDYYAQEGWGENYLLKEKDPLKKLIEEYERV